MNAFNYFSAVMSEIALAARPMLDGVRILAFSRS